MGEEQILEKLKEAIISFDEKLAEITARDAVEGNIDPLKAVEDGLVKGLTVIGEKYENDEIFLPELMMAANTFQKAMFVLEPKIAEMGKERSKKGVIVIGTVKGDIHKIGKDIVILLMKTAGYEVHDLGEDVDLFTFIDTAKKVEEDVIDALTQQGIREKYVVIIGGGATTPEWAETIGADLYAENAQVAVRKLTEMLEKRK